MVNSKEKLQRAINFLYCFIGTNRTGKSATAANLARAWKNTHEGQDIIAHDPQENFTDIATVFIQPEDDEWALKCLEYRNVLIILDDYRLINEGNRPVKGLMQLLYFRAKYNIDMIVICHNPSLLINALAHFISHYYIFMTNAQEGAFKNKIPNYSLCVLASDYVNKYVAAYGRGTYPYFPFIIVDCEKQKLMAFNMAKNPGNNNQIDTESNLIEEKPRIKRLGTNSGN